MEGTPDTTNSTIEKPKEVVQNPNSITEILSIGHDLPTSPNKVYRSVSTKEAIDDIKKSGIVRNKKSAGLAEHSRWGDRVFWSRGAEGKFHTVSEDGYVIEAPLSVASERAVTEKDITAIYTKEGGKVVNTLKREDGTLEESAAKLSETDKHIREIEGKKDELERKISDIRLQMGLKNPSAETPPSVQKYEDEIDRDKEARLLHTEVWRKEIEERFGITDFNIEIFLRSIYNDDVVDKARAEGRDWRYIMDNCSEGQSYDQAYRAVRAMEALEAEAPGSVKMLHEKWGITNFQRYPKDILIQQVGEIDKDKGLGLLVFAEDDYNGAFDDQQDRWSKLYDHRKNDLNFVIIESNSKLVLARKLLEVRKDTNKNISFAVVSAHSKAGEFYLGDKEIVGDKYSVDQEDIKEFQSRAGEIFTEDAQLIGNACSSGDVNGWVHGISKSARIKAVGPANPQAIKDFSFHGNEVVPEYYEPGVYRRYYKGFLLSK